MENKTQKTKYIPTVCDYCGQTTDYPADLDRGSALIVIAILNGQHRLHKKEVHLRRDLLAMPRDFRSIFEAASLGYMTPTMVTNVFRPQYHGLVAPGQQTGTFLVTRKGAAFLRSDPVMRTAIIDKKTHTKKTYLDENGTITLYEILRNEPFWAGEFAKLEKAAAIAEEEFLSGERLFPL